MMDMTQVDDHTAQFRYTLRRHWNALRPRCIYVMLNPSTADDLKDDATIRKCIGFADRLGFGGFGVVNLFAYRATKPIELKRAGWPVGEFNDDAIRQALQSGKQPGTEVICAWGAHEMHTPVLHRAIHVVEMIKDAGYDPKVLAWNVGNTQSPRHPLVLGYARVPGLLPLGNWPWKGE